MSAPVRPPEVAATMPAPRVLRAGPASVRVDVRAVLVGAVLAAVTLVLAAVLVTTGDVPVSLPAVLASLTGRGDAGTDFVVLTLRLPRVVAAVLVGAALGISGTVFQTVTRNPLGSPDFVGLTVGAASGALVAILVLGAGAASGVVAAAAIAGCVLTALAGYGLAFRRDGVPAIRLILVGIGVAAMLEALNSFLIVRARLEEAAAAQLWLVGSLNGRGWEHVRPVAVALAVLLPAVLLLGRRLTMLTLGDEIAVLAGVPAERTRIALLGIGVGLAAVATAATGPVAFVALAAPQLAVRLTRSGGPGLLPAAAMGALVLVASDALAQHVPGGTPLPVGVVTGALGGAYLVWLLATQWRRR